MNMKLPFLIPHRGKPGGLPLPTLFAIFINDLAENIKKSGVGLELDQETVLNIFLYADDIVLIA